MVRTHLDWCQTSDIWFQSSRHMQSADTDLFFLPPVAAKRSIMQGSGFGFVQLDWPCMNTERVAFVPAPPGGSMRGLSPISGNSLSRKLVIRTGIMQWRLHVTLPGPGRWNNSCKQCYTGSVTEQVNLLDGRGIWSWTRHVCKIAKSWRIEMLGT